MNVALVGLMAREAVALDMLASRLLPGWQCQAVPAGRGVPLPAADLYVVDLAGWRLARWTEAAQGQLLDALGGAPAVLVVPAFDQTWMTLDAGRMNNQSLVLLHKPYGVEDMRAALTQAVAGRARPAAPAVLPALAPAPAAPVGRPRPAVSAAHVPSPSPAASAPDIEGGALSAHAFQLALDARPASEPTLFLRRLAQALALGQPFEVRVTFLNRLIVDPGAQWVASNTPPAVLRGLCQNDALASATEVDAVDAGDAMARAQRLDLPVAPLDSFLWALMQGRLAEAA